MNRIMISAALLFVPGFAMGMSVDDFITAACRNDEVTVRRFLDNGGNINGQEFGGVTALHYAAWSANINIMKLLLDRGADVNLADTDGDTALHYTVRRESIEIVTLLCNRNDIRPSLNTLNAEGNTPYDLAMYKGLHDMAQILKDTASKLSLVKGIPTGE